MHNTKFTRFYKKKLSDLRLFAVSMSLLLLVTWSINAQGTLAFPGAEGFGKYASGGRGGDVIMVTNLNDNGPGSLRDAIEAEGPRIVVFMVSGLIDLETTLTIWNPYITIAGQTAPGQGVCIRGNYLRIRTHDVIIRFLRIRPGDVSFGPGNAWGQLDAIGFSQGRTDVYNVIIDHCSLSWAVDEVIGAWGNPYNITIQNSIISEGLHNSQHPKGAHSRGILIGSFANNISILNNLIMHHAERNPQITNSGNVDVRNNIIYNPRDYAAMIGNWSNPKQFVNFVGNVFIKGPSTRFDHEFSVYDPMRYNGKLYLRDNIGFEGNSNHDNWNMVRQHQPRINLSKEEIELIKSDQEFLSNVSHTKTFIEMNDYIQSYVGACLPTRDNVDRRLIYELNTRSGKIIDSQNEVGGWPGSESGFIKTKNDYHMNYIEGIPREWMEKYNILPGQEHLDFNGNGYTNVEEYLNGTDPGSISEPDAKSVFIAYSTFYLLEIEDYRLNVVPNPFNEYSKIWFSLNDKARVLINIFDSSGRTIAQLVDTSLFEGHYEFIWIPSGLIPGIYIAVLTINEMKMDSQKIIFQN